MVMDEDKVRQILASDFIIKGDVEIQSDLSVNVGGDVRMTRRSKTGLIPIKFGIVDGEFRATHMNLTSLENAPDSCHDLYVSGNRLTSLKYCPVYLGTLDVSNNRITNFHHAPDIVRFIHAYMNPLTSLEGFANSDSDPDAEIDYVDITFDPHLPMLRLLNAEEIHVSSPGPGYSHITAFQPVHDILNKYAGQGKAGALKCAAELIRAGFKENARW